MLEDSQGGLQADGRRDFGVQENRADGLEGGSGESVGFFADEQCSIVLRLREGGAEDGGGASPIADGVAVDFGLSGGFGDGGTVGDGGDNLVLNGR